MMFEGRSLELLIAAVFALIVVGPKDLPIMLRKLGQFTAKLRGMAAEFRASFDEMARQSELDDLRKEVEALRRGQIADASLETTVQEIHQELTDVGVQLDHSAGYGYADPPPPAAPIEVEAAAEATASPAVSRANGAPKKPRARKTATSAPAEGAKAPAKRAPAKRAAKPKAEKGA